MSSEQMTAFAVTEETGTIRSPDLIGDGVEQPVSVEPITSPKAAKARHWLRWILRPVVIYLISRAVTLIALVISTATSHKSVRGEIDLWDSRWFIRAAEYGWPSQLPHVHGHVAGNTTAFFPLFPLTIRWLSYLTGFSLLTAGVMITSATGLTAIVAVWALVRHYAGQNAADRATLLLALFPGSFVLSMVYSEGMAITFVALGILALMRRRWLVAGVFGMLATAVTPIALAFMVSCAWCAYREMTRHRNWRSLAALVVTPLGFIAYQLWLWQHTGTLMAWRLTERGGWHSYPSLLYSINIVTSFLRDPVAATKTGDLLFTGIVVAAICVIVAIRDRMPMPMFLYGLSAGILALVSVPVGLRPRFIFLAFPLVLAVGTRLRGWVFIATLATSTVLLIALTILTVSTYQVFP